MILNRMEIENIRSHDGSVIEFRPGVLLFQGDIGSGKSSILYSLEFVLFGGTERNFYDKLLRHGADKASVKLDFKIDGSEYTAYRSIKRKTDSIRGDKSYLEKDGVRMELSWQEMRDKIVELLQLRESSRGSVQTFHMSIYTPQEKMKEILSMNADERLEAIRKVFNLEEYKIAVDNISTVRSGLAETIREHEVRAERLDDVEEKIDVLEKEKREKEEELEDSKEEIGDKREELDEVKGEKKELEKLKEKKSELDSEKKLLEDKLTSLDEDIIELEKKLKDIEKGEERLEEIEDKKDRYLELEKEIVKVRKEVKRKEELQNEIKVLKNERENKKENMEELKEAEKEIQKLEEEIDELEKKTENLDELKEKKENLREEHSDLEGELRSLKREKKSILDEKKEMEELEGGGECPKCKQDIDQEHIDNIIEELEEEESTIIEKIQDVKESKGTIKKGLDEVREDISELQDAVNNLKYKKKEKRNLVKKIEKGDGLKSRIKGLDENISRYEDELEDMEFDDEQLESLIKERDELQSYRDEYMTLQNKIKEKDEVIEKKETKENRKKEKKEKLEELKGELEEVISKFSQETFEKVVERYEKLIGDTRKLEERISNLEDSISGLKEDIEERQKDKKEMEKSREKARELKTLKAWISGDFKEGIKAIEEHRMSKLNMDFESYFKTWFDNILDDPEITARLDEDFSPLVTIDGDETMVSDLSGGERTSVALAYRLAFNTMIKKELGLKSNLLVLDEPTTGFSREQLTKLKDVMENITADQVIIVSHENEIANLADYEYTVMKRDGISTVQKVT